ncbi:MAG: HAD hydrolase-like protein [Pseudomonadales bacterium]|nr:HAD hydrolase-like protein [Pseudomonadales bacterium]
MQNSAATPALGAIFFDLDGTLTDPKEGITGCVQHALKQMSEPVPSKDELTWCIGPPLVESFTTLVGAARAAEGVGWYRERFSTVGLFENAVYEGIPEVLRQLSERYPLYVASSKPLVFVDQILEHFDLAGFFTRTFGSNLDGSLADKSELLQYALAATGIRAQQALMIGDRSHDAVGAKNNGMDFVGALYGYGSAAEFKASGFARWVTQPSELPPTITGDC